MNHAELDIVPEIVVQKTQVLDESRQSRSPNRVQTSVNVELLGGASAVPRERSRSPIWCPGNTTYADVLKGMEAGDLPTGVTTADLYPSSVSPRPSRKHQVEQKSFQPSSEMQTTMWSPSHDSAVTRRDDKLTPSPSLVSPVPQHREIRRSDSDSSPEQDVTKKPQRKSRAKDVISPPVKEASTEETKPEIPARKKDKKKTVQEAAQEPQIVQEPQKPSRKKSKKQKKAEEKAELATPTSEAEIPKIDDSDLYITRTITIIRKKIIRHITVINGKEHVTEEVIEEPVEMEVTGQEIPILEPEIVIVDVEEPTSESVSDELSMETDVKVSQSSEVEKSLKYGEVTDNVVEVRLPIDKQTAESSAILVSEIQEVKFPTKAEEKKPERDEPKKPEREKAKARKKKKEKNSKQNSDEESLPESLPEKITKFVTIIKKKIVRHVRIVDGKEQVTEEVLEEPAQVEVVGDELPVIEPEIETSYVEEKIEFKPISEQEVARKASESPLIVKEIIREEITQQYDEKEDKKQPLEEIPIEVAEIAAEIPQTEIPLASPQIQGGSQSYETAESAEQDSALDQIQDISLDRWDGDQLDSIPEGEETEEFSTLSSEEIKVTQSIVDLDNRKVFAKTKHVKKSVKFVDGQEQVTEEVEEEPIEYDLTGNEIPVFRNDAVTLVHKDHLGEYSKAFPEIQDSEDASIIQTVVRQTTRKVVRHVTKVLRSVTIIDGKEHVTEEVIEVPEEVEVTEDAPEYHTEIVESGSGKPLWKYIIIQSPEENVERTIVVNKVNVIRNIVIKDGKKSVIEEHIDEPVEIRVTQEETPIYDADIIALIEQNAAEIIKARIPFGENEEVEDVIAELAETAPAVLFEVPEIPAKLTNGNIESSVVDDVKSESAKVLDDVNNEEKREGTSSNLEFIVTKSYKVDPEAFVSSEDQVELEPIILDATSSTEKRKKSVQFDDTVTVIAETPLSGETEDVRLGERDSTAPEINVGQLRENLDMGQDESVPEIASYIEQRETQHIFIDPAPFMIVEFPEICAEFTLTADAIQEEVDEAPELIKEVVNQEEVVAPNEGDKLAFLQNLQSDLANATTYNAFLDAERDFYRFNKPEKTIERENKEISIVAEKESAPIEQTEAPEAVEVREVIEVQSIIKDHEHELVPEEVQEEVQEKIEIVIETKPDEILQDTAPEPEILDTPERVGTSDIQEKTMVSHYEVPHFDVLSMSEAERNYFLYLNSAQTIPKQIDEVSFTAEEVKDDDDDVIVIEDEPEVISVDDTHKANVTQESSFTENDRSMEEIEIKQVPEAQKPAYAGLPLDDTVDSWMDSEIVLSDDEEPSVTVQVDKPTHEIQIVTIMREKIIRHIKIINGKEEITEEIVREPMEVEVIDGDIPDFKPEIIIIEENEENIQPKSESQLTEESENQDLKDIPQSDDKPLAAEEKPSDSITEKITKIITIIRKKIIRHVKVVDGKEQVTEEVIEEPVEVEVVGDEIPTLEPEIVISHVEEIKEAIPDHAVIEDERNVKKTDEENPPAEVAQKEESVEVVSQPDAVPQIVEVEKTEVIVVEEPAKEAETVPETVEEKIEIVESIVEKEPEAKPLDVASEPQILQTVTIEETVERVKEPEIALEEVGKSDIPEVIETVEKTEIVSEAPVTVLPEKTTEKVTRTITIIRKKIIRRVIVVDGKENVTEEVVEEPVEVEIVGDEVPILEPEIEVVREVIEVKPVEEVKEIQPPVEEKEMSAVVSGDEEPRTETIVRETRVITIIRKRIIRHVTIVDGKEEVREEVIEEPVEVEVFGDEMPSLEDLLPEGELETVENVTEEVIRSGQKIIQHIEIIDGKEHVTEEVIDLPEEIEIIGSSDTSLEIIPKESVVETVTEKIAAPVVEKVEKPAYAGLPLDESSDAWMDVDEMVFSEDEEEVLPQETSAKENDRSMEEVEIAVVVPSSLEQIEEPPQPKDLILDRTESIVEIDISDSNQLEKFLQQERLSHLPKEVKKDSQLSADAQEFIPQKKEPKEEIIDVETKHIAVETLQTEPSELPEEFDNVVVEQISEEKSISSEPKKLTEQQLREKMLFEQKKKLKREMRGKKKQTDEVKAVSSSPELLKESSTDESPEPASVWALPGDKKTYAEVVAANLARKAEKMGKKPVVEVQSREETSEEDSTLVPLSPPKTVETIETVETERIVEEIRREEPREPDVQKSTTFDDNFSWYDAIVEQEKLLASAEPSDIQYVEKISTEPQIPAEVTVVEEAPQPQSSKSWASVVGSFVSNLFESTPKPQQPEVVVQEKRRESSPDNLKSTSDSDDKAQKSTERKSVKTKKMPVAKEPEPDKKKQPKKAKKGKSSGEESPSSEKGDDSEWIILSTPKDEDPLKPEPKAELEVVPGKIESKKEKQKKKKKSKKSSSSPDFEQEETVKEFEKEEEIKLGAAPIDQPEVKEVVQEDTPEEKPTKKSKKKSKKPKKHPEKQTSSDSLEQDWVDVKPIKDEIPPPTETSQITKTVTIIRKKIIRYVVIENGVERVTEEISEEPVEVEVTGDELPILLPEIITIDQSPTAPVSEEPFFVDTPVQDIPQSESSLPDKITEHITKRVTIIRKKIIRYITIIDGREQVNEEMVEEPVEIEVIGDEIPELEPEIVVVKELELEPVSREKLSSTEPDDLPKNTDEVPRKLEVATEIVIAESKETPVDSEPVVETKELKEKEMLVKEENIPKPQEKVTEFEEENLGKSKKKSKKDKKKKNVPEETQKQDLKDIPQSDDKPLAAEEKPSDSITEKITKIITIIRKKIIRHVKVVDGKEQVTEEVIEEPVEVEVVGNEIPTLEPEIVISHVEEIKEVIPDHAVIEDERNVKKTVEENPPAEVAQKEESVELVSQPDAVPQIVEVEKTEVIVVEEPAKVVETVPETVGEKIEIVESIVEKEPEAKPLDVASEPQILQTVTIEETVERVKEPEITLEKVGKSDIPEVVETVEKTEIISDAPVTVLPEKTTEKVTRTITIMRKKIIRRVIVVDGKENVTEEVVEEPVEVEIVGDEVPILEPEIEVVREVIEVKPVEEVKEIQPPVEEKEISAVVSGDEEPRTETIVRETRVITIIRKRIIRHVTIVDGKEEVREEVIEEPVEVEVFGDEMPSLEDLLPEGELETVENVTEEVIRSGQKIIQHIEIIDGKEHVTEEVIDLPEEIEIIGSSDTSLEIIPKESVETVIEKIAAPVVEKVEKPAYAGLPLDESSDAWMDVDEMVFSEDEEEVLPQETSAKENDRSMEEVEIVSKVLEPVVDKKAYAGLPMADTSDDWMIVDEMVMSDEEEPEKAMLSYPPEAVSVSAVMEGLANPEEILYDDILQEIWTSNVQLDTNFWPNKYLYNDAEKAFIVQQQIPPKDDSDMQLKRNLAQDLSSLPDIFSLSDAERLWQTLLSHERPEREVSVDVDESVKERKDDDDDEDRESHKSDSPVPLVVNIDTRVSSRDTRDLCDLPGGGKWRGESTYLSIESIGDYPETAHESEQHPIQLESTNITQTPPPSPVQTPILESPPDLFLPPNTGISDRIIAHSTEPLVVTEPSDNSVQLNKKDAVTREIDQLLASIASTERDLVNLSNEDLTKMLEKLRDILEALKTHDSEATVIKENVSIEEPDQDVDKALTTIDSKIEKLVARATKAFSLVEDAINQQQMRQLELKKYSQLQQEIENWLLSIQIPSTKTDQEINTVEGVQEIVADQLQLIEDITSKEQRLQKIRDKCQEMQSQEHVRKLATTLTEQFTIILTLLETRKQSTLNYIAKLKTREDELVRGKKEDDKDTLESMSMPEEEPDVQRMTIETQTSVREEKIQDDETQTSFPLLESAPRDTQTTFVQTQDERRPTDNITVLHTSDEEKETFKIDNQLNQPISKDERPSDVLVEAKFNQTQPGGGPRTSELVLRNVPQSFETTFVEPDETTTEVVVDSDGTKRIIVKKVKRTRVQREIITQSVTVGAESIPQVQEEITVEEIPLAPGQEDALPENLAALEQAGTSTIQTIVQHVTRKIVRKTKKIIKKVTIIDGKEHVTEEVVEEPEEVEISEEELPNVNINLTSGVDEYVIEEPVVEEKDEVTYEIVQPESVSPKEVKSKESSRDTSGSDDKNKGEEDRQVLESLSAPVDLLPSTAHVDVIQPNVEIAEKEDVRDGKEEEEEKTVEESAALPSPLVQETLEITQTAPEQPVEGIPAQKELILTDIQEIWPTTIKTDEIPVHLLDKISIGDDTQIAIDHTTDGIWPTNPDIGADVDLQRYGVSVTEVEHVIETVEKHPEEKSLEITEKPVIDELKAVAEVVETQQPSPSEPSTPSEPSEKVTEPAKPTRADDEAERTRIKVTLPSLTSQAESMLIVDMKMDPSEHTKINVNLTEEVSLVAQPIESPKISTPVEKIIPEKVVIEVHEKLSGSDEQEVRQTGYEPEDVTVDDVNEESRKSKRKKKKKQKIKAKDDESSEVSKSADEKESVHSEPKSTEQEKSSVQQGVEREITPDESYASISEYSEADSVRIMEESVIQSPPPDDLKPMPSELVTTVPVIDTMYVEESEQQTSLPYEEVSREEAPRLSAPKEAVIQEEHSVQTSPTPQQPVTEISQQTSPEPEPDHQETESQTIVIESTEVEIQTTPVKMSDEEPVVIVKPEVTSEEIQTEPVVFEEKVEPQPIVETSDSTSQTVILDTREQNLQTSPMESPEHRPKEVVSTEEDVNRIAARIVEEIVAGIPTPTATQETNTETVTIQEATVQTTPEVPAAIAPSPEVPDDSSLSTTTSEPYEIHVKASLIYPEGEQPQKIPDNFSVEVTRTFDLEDDDGPRSFHEIVEIPSSEEPTKPKTVTISLTKKTVVDELFDEPDAKEEQRKVERLLEGRLRMAQEARESPLSNVLHLATLGESLTEEPAEERLEALQEDLLELRNAIQRQDSQVIQRTVTIIFEKISIWLETIEYRVYVTRQSASSGPTEKRIGEFNELRNELECIQNYVEHLRADLEQPMQDVESDNMVQCVNVIVDHLRAIDNVTQSSEIQVQEDFRRFSEYQMNVDELQLNIQQLRNNLDRIVSEEMGLDKKLHLLDEFDDINRAFGKEVQRLIYVARGLERDFPEKETPEQIFMCREMVANLEGSINIERNRLNQLVNLAQEYEQTLKEFAKIILIADSLVESQITTNNLDNLQNEIQKHRKFFVNLSHCRAILESLEMNLDPVTREKHSQLHQTLHESATTILDKASDRAQRLSMAASRWTVLERGMKEEKQWLQIAQQRIPDLSDVTSTDYDQYINMYQSLSSDIAHHHAKLVQLTTTAVKLQELVSASNVEDDCNEQLFMILKLKEDVALHLKKLLKFRQYWILYETTTDKIENWITTSEHHLEKIEIPKFFKDYPLEHMRLFWDIKAEFELYNSIKNDATSNLERALEVVPIADELLQKEFHERLESKWLNVEEKIQKIQQSIVDSMSASNVPTDEKLSLLQKELEELEKSMATTKGVIKSQDELQLYIERMQILNSRVVIVGTELGRIGLTSSSDSERIGRLFGVSHRISMQISEELDGALVLQDQLNKISHGIIRMRLLQQSAGETLNQCEAIDLSGSEIVENALYDCQRVHSDLKNHWQGIMELRQLLHTLPMRLKISVSPVMLERDISQLQDDHVLLESKCEKVLSSLRGALHLWKTFEKQLEQVQQSIQQTDYMVELLKVHGQVDYERLVKATERLQGLHGDLDNHEDLLEDLKCSSEPLIEICSEEVAHKIEVAVQETIHAWNETSQNLTDLCNKYQRAVRLWQQYRDATEALNNFVDEKEGEVKIMDPNGDLQYIKECLNALPLYKERLAEVRKMVDQISSDIELEPGNLLEMDVEALGSRLETMKEAITVLADEAEKKARQTVELEKEVRDSQKQLEATQKAIEDIPEEIATEEHLLNLRNHLVKLNCTQNQLQKMHSTKLEQNITTNVSIVEVLKIWQRLFKDTFQQYYRLSSTLIQNEDIDAVLKLWEDYLRHVQTFLATSIPQNYSSLSDHRHICEVHQNLLVSQKNVYEMNVKPHVAERFTDLVRLHNDVLQKLNMRHSEVEERINLWDKYNREMTELLEWLRDMEQSRTRMQLSYLNLRRVPKIRQTLESILGRVDEGEVKSKELKEQHGVLLKFCDDALGTSIKMGHAAVNQRISNLKAALETWLDFVNRIVHLENVYRQKVAYVQDSLQTTQKLYTEMSQKNQVTDKNIKQQINDLRERRIDVNKLSVDLEQIGVVLEEMKECVSPYDLKSMRQIVWILWQQQGDLNQQLGTFINNLVDKLSLWKMFNDKYTVLSAWMDHLEKRIEMGTQFVYVGEPEEIQRYIENEIATEMSFKERDRDWVLSSGRQLLTLFSDSDNQAQAMEIQEKLNTIIERWEKLKYLTKVRGNELKDLRLTTMRLEIRIAELRSWLFKMETEVTRPLHLADLSEASHRKSWQEHDELQKAMEKECINFAEVLNLCDMLFKDVNTWKSHFNIGALSVAINNVENRWANVCSLLTARGNKILTMWNLFGELQRLDNENKHWVLEKKRLVDELLREKVPRDELAERVEFVREQIEDVRMREAARHLQEKNYHGLVASNTLDTNNINELLGDLPIVLNDWSTLLPALMALHERLQTDLCLYGKFVQSHEKAVLNLTQIDAHLTQTEHQLPAEEASASKSQQILAVEEELKDCSELLETADKLGLALMETVPDVAPIQAMVDEYQNLYRDISQRLESLREKYVAEVDESVQVNTLTFEQDSAVQVNTLTFVTAKDAYIMELKSAIKEMKNNLTNLEKALNDTEAKSLRTIKSNKIVAACESSVELIRHLSMLLKTECNSTDDEASVEEVKDLLAKHENLMILWRSKEQKLQELSDLGRLTCPLCTQKNWQQIDNDLWRLEQWLQFAEGTQRLQTSPPANISDLEDVIQDHREFLLDLNSHKSIVASLNVVGDHLATHTLDTERAEQLRERLERNNQRWEKVCQNAAKWQSSLQTTLMGNKEFHSIIDELCTWLESTEAKIRAAEPVDLTVSREIMLTKFRRFRDLRSELERCEPRVVSLQEAADQLLKASTESGSEESSAVIYTRLTDLRLRLQSLRRLTGVYVVKLGAVLGVESTEISLRTVSPYQTQSTNQLDEFGVPLEGAHSSPQLNEDGSSGGDEINTNVLARGYRFLGRVLRASLPIQALMLLLLGVVTLVPHAEDYSCIFTNNFARSLEPMLRYPNGPPPI